MNAALPVADGYKHSTEETARIADRFTILRTQVGSGVHGVTVSDDDRDEMGICVEPPDYVIGLRRFDQYEYRSQPPHHRSGPGDLDLTIYSLRKWMRLALRGNPTVLIPLFVPPEEVVTMTAWGRDLRENPRTRTMLLSRRAGERFLGYLNAQRERMISGRPELLEQFGFDTKFAYHAIRLGIQGCELLRTGRIRLPMAEPMRTWLQELRRGEHTKDEALARIAEYEADLKELMENGTELPDEPDYDEANRWLIKVHNDIWSRLGDSPVG